VAPYNRGVIRRPRIFWVLSLVALILAGCGFLATTATADIAWTWRFSTEAGTLVTDGEFDEFGEFGTADPGTYTILDFTVEESVDPSLAGSLLGGEIFEAQPAQGFIWDGYQDTEWFRDTEGLEGILTNGSNFFSGVIGTLRWVFIPGNYRLNDFLLGENLAQATELELVAVPEPTSGLLALTALLTLAGLRRRAV
jgi:hypothetical protein